MSAVSPDCETTIVRPSLLDRRLAIAIFRGDVDLDRQPGEALDPVFADQAGHVGGAAADDRNPRQPCRIDRPGEGAQPLRGHVDVMGEGVADDFGLFVNFLRHEVAIIAFFGEQPAGRTAQDAALDDFAGESWNSAASRVTATQSPSSR